MTSMIGCGFHFTKRQLHTLHKGGSVLALPAHNGAHLQKPHYEGVVMCNPKMSKRHSKLCDIHGSGG